LAEVMTGTRLHRSALEEHLDVSQFGEIEVTLLIESVILQTKFLHSAFELFDFGSTDTSTSANTAGCWGDSLTRAGTRSSS